MENKDKIPTERIELLDDKLNGIFDNLNTITNQLVEIGNSITELSNRRYITETWNEGTSWYRVWSDGWIEQGGRYTPKSNPSYINFYKPYTNTNYTLSLNVQDTSPTDCALTVCSWNALTAENAQIYQGYNGGGQTMPLMWIAYGY